MFSRIKKINETEIFKRMVEIKQEKILYFVNEKRLKNLVRNCGMGKLSISCILEKNV